METLKDLDLVRAIQPRPTLARVNGAAMPTMNVDFSVFGTWYEIDSWFEGQFLERTMTGSFKKTIRENGNNVKVLFDHGMDYQIGNKVLGPIEKLTEETSGPHAEVPLLDTTYNRDLLPGLEAGLYGSSFRFRVIKEQWNDEPGTSDYNPRGIPERTILEVKLMEFGPVTFPANPDSTAGVRALTDEFHGRIRARNPEAYTDLVARRQSIKVVHRAAVVDPAESDLDDDPATLAASLDAVLDEAVGLFQGVDTSGLEPDVQQGIALVNAADALADELLEVMGVADADDDGIEEKNSVKPLNDTSRNGTPKGAATDKSNEPINDHSEAPFIPAVTRQRVERKAAYMNDYLALIMRGASRYDD